MQGQLSAGQQALQVIAQLQVQLGNMMLERQFERLIDQMKPTIIQEAFKIVATRQQLGGPNIQINLLDVLIAAMHEIKFQADDKKDGEGQA